MAWYGNSQGHRKAACVRWGCNGGAGGKGIKKVGPRQGGSLLGSIARMVDKGMAATARQDAYYSGLRGRRR